MKFTDEISGVRLFNRVSSLLYMLYGTNFICKLNGTYL